MYVKAVIFDIDGVLVDTKLLADLVVNNLFVLQRIIL